MNERIKKKVMGVLKGMPHFDKLRFVCLYGSKAKGKATKLSDIDICMYYDIKNGRVLSRLLYRIKGSLPEKYDVQLFQLLPLSVRNEIFKGTFIYTKAPKYFLYDLAFRTFREYEEFEPRYKFYVLNTKEHPRRFML